MALNQEIWHTRTDQKCINVKNLLNNPQHATHSESKSKDQKQCRRYPLNTMYCDRPVDVRYPETLTRMMLNRYDEENEHKRIKKQRRYERLATTSQLSPLMW
ncbi:hypothetical protein BGX26_009001, partial [Mortierella sp. AD094]